MTSTDQFADAFGAAASGLRRQSSTAARHMEVIGRPDRGGGVQTAQSLHRDDANGVPLTCASELHPPVNTEHRGEAPSRTAAPVVDAVVIGPAVLDAPQDGVRSRGHADSSVRGADVGLDGVDAEVHDRGDLDVGLALRDERKDLGFAVGEALAASWPIQSNRQSRPWWRIADDDLAGSDCFDRGHELARGVSSTSNHWRLWSALSTRAGWKFHV